MVTRGRNLTSFFLLFTYRDRLLLLLVFSSLWSTAAPIKPVVPWPGGVCSGLAGPEESNAQAGEGGLG